MDAVFLVPDPLLPSVDSPRGAIEIRRVVGMLPDERELMEPWSVKGLSEVMRASSPDLTTDIKRPSLAANRALGPGCRHLSFQAADPLRSGRPRDCGRAAWGLG
jgi:hypothetical protein